MLAYSSAYERHTTNEQRKSSPGFTADGAALSDFQQPAKRKEPMSKKNDTADPPNKEPAFLTARQASELTGLTVNTLTQYRSERYCERRGMRNVPPWYRLTNGHAAYDEAELLAWMAETGRKSSGGRSNG